MDKHFLITNEMQFWEIAKELCIGFLIKSVPLGLCLLTGTNVKVTNHVNGIISMTCELNSSASLMNEMMYNIVEKDEEEHHLFMELLIVGLRIGLDFSF